MAKGENDKPQWQKEIARLERRLKRHQLFSLFITSFLGIIVVITAIRRDFPELRTNRLKIMHGQQEAVTLEARESGGGNIVIFNSQEVPIIQLIPSASESGSIITRDPEGTPLNELSRTHPAGALHLFHQNGSALVGLANTTIGCYFCTFSKEEKPLIRLSRTYYGGDLSLFQEEEEEVSAALTTLGQGGAQVINRTAMDNLLR